MGEPEVRLRCMICGRNTSEAPDYIKLAVSTEISDTEQFFGAHASCLESVMASGFHVEVF